MASSSLNAVYSQRGMKRRYEVWFLRLYLTDGSGAWWFRYLLLNPGRDGGGCPGNPVGQPVQVWATWFPRDGQPQSFIQGFSSEQLSLSPRGAAPFHLQIERNRIGEDSCCGCLEVNGRRVRWDLRYHSTAGFSITEVGWIGFSRTPHSDAVFSGEIECDGRVFRSDPLGFGLQGHNCGFRHRNLWNWTHVLIREPDGSITTFEALEYEIPLRQRFRKALLWRHGKLSIFKKLHEVSRSREHLQWVFAARATDGTRLLAILDGRGSALHRLPYLKTNCSATFEVVNNSLARATLVFCRAGQNLEQITTDGGAVIEMAGD
jgi:hypothetical protein